MASKRVDIETETRERTMTEKGVAYKLETLDSERKRLLARLNLKATNLNKALNEEPHDTSKITVLYEELKNEFCTFYSTHQEYLSLITDTIELEKQSKWYKESAYEFFKLEERVNSKLNLNSTLQDNVEAAEESSVATSASSLMLKRADAAAERAVAAKANEFLFKEEELLKALRKLQAEKSIATAEAKEEAYRKFDIFGAVPQPPIAPPASLEPSTSVQALPSKGERNRKTLPLLLQESAISKLPSLTRRDAPPLGDNVPNFKGGVSTELKMVELMDTLADIQRRSHVPGEEPEVFSGDLTEFPTWILDFEDLIETNFLTARQRLRMLKKYTAGEARSCISGYLSSNSDRAYEKAKATLMQWFGNPANVTRAFKTKLKNWPNIHTKDGGVTLCQFSHFLEHCLFLSEESRFLRTLNDDDLNQILAAKLPKYIRDRWSKIALDYETNKREFPPFSRFCELIKYEARLATLPVVGTAVLDKFVLDNSPNPSNSSNRTATRSSRITYSSLSAEEEICICCDELSHPLYDCPRFITKIYEERVRFIREKGLCFACLRSGHMSNSCPRRLECNICKRKHPTLLHTDNVAYTRTQEVNATANLLTSQRENVCTTKILPVVVKHPSNINTQILVYAILDEQSDTSFISDDLREMLNVPSTPVNLKLATMTSSETISTNKITELQMSGISKNCEVVVVPECYTRDVIHADRNHVLNRDTLRRYPKFSDLVNEIPDYMPDLDVHILVGRNCIKALEPCKVIVDHVNHCYATETRLGWTGVGFFNSNETKGTKTKHCNFITHSLTRCRQRTKELINPSDAIRCLERDFFEHKDQNVDLSAKGLSIEDKKFISICKDNVKQLEDRHFELPLPFKTDVPFLPCNKNLALKRLKSIRRKFMNDSNFKEQYSMFIEDLLNRGYAERVDKPMMEANIGRVWYLPHHAVFNINKPSKIRVVFDASAKFLQVALNDVLLQGPNLTNNLIGVLLRFRQGRIAVMADIEKMFLQVKVKEEHRNFLRFLFWPQGDIEREVAEYRMCSHIFGAISSPSIASFALRHCAETSCSKFGLDAANLIKENFYVDDGLASFNSDIQAIDVMKKTKNMCKAGGFNLTKFVSNDKTVLESLTSSDSVCSVNSIDLSKDKLPIEKALGVHWNTDKDFFHFQIAMKDKPSTRRGILSIVSSVFDPLGLISPVVLEGKRILQRLCKDGSTWDDPVPAEVKDQWETWKRGLSEIENLRIPRCIQPLWDCNDVKIELHHFSDAATDFGYGQCSYIRYVNSYSQIHCALLMAKSRVVPIKPVRIPRLELTAAVVSAKIAASLRTELDLKDYKEYFWVDSKVVLGWIKNETRRFSIYVTHRIQEIRDISLPSQWNYISTSHNPADLCSRGISAKKFVQKQDKLYFPDVLRNVNLPISDEKFIVEPDDSELKIACFQVNINEDFTQLLDIICKKSSWIKMKYFIASWIRIKNYLLAKKSLGFQRNFSQTELFIAEVHLLKLLQANFYSKEIAILTKLAQTDPDDKVSALSNKRLNTSSLARLNPFLDDNGLIRIGGRLKNSSLSDHVKHPVIVPKKSQVTQALIGYYHELLSHQGRGMTINRIRTSGYWIINASSSVRRYISGCVKCKKLRGAVQNQKMANLPKDRIEVAPPFTYTGVDVFGPFTIMQRRSEVKRYGILFTCLQCRAIRIEIAPFIDTSSFLNALRRFLCRNGPIKLLRCDQGTNFVGASHELKRELEKIDSLRIANRLSNDYQCDFIKFEFNPPSASHFGGVWERQIGTVRKILTSLLGRDGNHLDDDSLLTLVIEAEAIVNSRPLTVNTLSSSDSLPPLSPNNLLTTKSSIINPPPGLFDRPDVYSKKRWRRVQHLADEFWRRWSKEYVLIQQQRSKWCVSSPNLRVNDIVLVIDDLQFRNSWKLARIVDTFASSDGLVRKVRCRLATKNIDSRGRPFQAPTVIDRPIHKLVLLVKSSDNSEA